MSASLERLGQNTVGDEEITQKNRGGGNTSIRWLVFISTSHLSQRYLFASSAVLPLFLVVLICTCSILL